MWPANILIFLKILTTKICIYDEILPETVITLVFLGQIFISLIHSTCNNLSSLVGKSCPFSPIYLFYYYITMGSLLYFLWVINQWTHYSAVFDKLFQLWPLEVLENFGMPPSLIVHFLRIIVNFSSLNPRINCFSKEPWLILLEGII